MRRLARGAGAVRVEGSVKDDLDNLFKIVTDQVLERSAMLAELCNKRTVSMRDMAYALKKCGFPVVWGMIRKPKKKPTATAAVVASPALRKPHVAGAALSIKPRVGKATSTKAPAAVVAAVTAASKKK